MVVLHRGFIEIWLTFYSSGLSLRRSRAPLLMIPAGYANLVSI
jgi:hypothetical protein